MDGGCEEVDHHVPSDTLRWVRPLTVQFVGRFWLARWWGNDDAIPAKQG